MPMAEDVFSETFARFWRNWAFISSLRQVADVAFPISKQALAAVHTDFIEQMSTHPHYKKLLVNLDGSESEWGEEVKSITRKVMTDGVLASARAAIDAASLIFAQSVLDDCALSYLKVCSLARPADWQPLIAGKKASFEEYYGKSQDEVRGAMIQEKLEQIGKESLLKKVDLLFQLCQPPKGFAPINKYSYDRDRLEKIDNTRHEIVHRNGMGKPVLAIDDDLDFISKTAQYLLVLVHSKYGVQINPAKAFGLTQPRQEAQT